MIMVPSLPPAKRQCTTRIGSSPARWTAEEDRLLAAGVERFGGRQWKLVATVVKTRNHAQCLQRWGKVLKPGLKKGPWAVNEDAQLSHLVGLTNGSRANWSGISSKIEGRTTKQCRERWFHHLDPSINREPFTQDEDKQIVAAQAKLGSKWADIARILNAGESESSESPTQFIKRRTSEAIKIRFKTLQRHIESGASLPCPQKIRSMHRYCLQVALPLPMSEVVAPAPVVAPNHDTCDVAEFLDECATQLPEATFEWLGLDEQDTQQEKQQKQEQKKQQHCQFEQWLTEALETADAVLDDGLFLDSSLDIDLGMDGELAALLE